MGFSPESYTFMTMCSQSPQSNYRIKTYFFGQPPLGTNFTKNKKDLLFGITGLLVSISDYLFGTIGHCNLS